MDFTIWHCSGGVTDVTGPAVSRQLSAKFFDTSNLSRDQRSPLNSECTKKAFLRNDLADD
jgi:hypothetical protein